MQKSRSNVTEKDSNSFWNNGLVIFFLAPIVFLFIVKFTGSQIFYGKDGSKKDAKKVWLLSAGTLFYVIMLIIGLS